MRILVVDDNEEGRYLLQTLLASNGFEVISAENGEAALRVAIADPPDLVISDILMPVMDGFTLCRKWKVHEVLSTIPFVFYSATYTEEADEELALSLGADRFIRKPAEPQAFVADLRQFVAACERGEIPVRAPEIEPEPSFLRAYNEVLIRKLEAKVVQMEAAYQALGESQEALARANQKLEGRVDERTAELKTLVAAMAGREIRMAELKKVISALRRQLRVAGIEPVADDPLAGAGADDGQDR